MGGLDPAAAGCDGRLPKSAGHRGQRHQRHQLLLTEVVPGAGELYEACETELGDEVK